MRNTCLKKEGRAHSDPRHALGLHGEEEACAYLVKQGCRILARNYRTPRGEIDIIAQEKKELVFVEVKTRKSFAYGYPEESVSFKKEQRIARAIRHYLSHCVGNPAYRVDIVAVSYGAGSRSNPGIYHVKGTLLRITI